MKINIYDLILPFTHEIIDYYVNINSLEIIEEYDFINLKVKSKKNYIKVPKIPFYKNIEFAINFQNNKEIKTLFNKLVIDKDRIKIIDDNELISYFNLFHCICEDNDLWGEFQEFRREEEKRIIITFTMLSQILILMNQVKYWNI